VALIVVCVIGAIVMHSMHGGLNQTSLFYIGLPAVLAILLVVARPASNPYSLVLRGATLFLLIAVIFLGEGFICVLLAAPIVYAVALLIAAGIAAHRRNQHDRGPRVLLLPALLLALAATEGTTSFLTLPTAQTVTATRTVAATADQVRAALARPLRFSTDPPAGMLALGFPRPLADHPDGLTPGAQRRIVFAGAAHRGTPLHQHHWGTAPSTLVLQLDSVGPRELDYRAAADGTPIATWLNWRTARISWKPVAGGTEVSWTLTFDRRLAPSLYWTPIERVVAGRAAGYLVGALDLPG
jgi:hypothetical protein